MKISFCNLCWNVCDIIIGFVHPWNLGRQVLRDAQVFAHSMDTASDHPMALRSILAIGRYMTDQGILDLGLHGLISGHYSIPLSARFRYIFGWNLSPPNRFKAEGLGGKGGGRLAMKIMARCVLILALLRRVRASTGLRAGLALLVQLLACCSLAASALGA